MKYIHCFILLTLIVGPSGFFSETALAQQVTQVQSEETQVGRDNRLSARISVGHLSGEAREYVYDGNTGEKFSELIWDLNQVLMAGVGVSFRPVPWLIFHADGWTKINDGEGDMDDYDWLPGNKAWAYWSYSNQVELDKGTIFDLSAEIKIIEQSSYSMGILVGYRVENWKWEDYGDGFYIYSNGGFRNDTGIFEGDTLGISYEQTFETPYVGVSMSAFWGDFELQTRLIGSTLVKLDAADNHYLRNLYFEDSCEEGEMLAIDINGRYQFAESLAVQLGYSYQKYFEVRGDNVVYYDGMSDFYPNSAAGELEYHRISVTLTYAF